MLSKKMNVPTDKTNLNEKNHPNQKNKNNPREKHTHIEGTSV